MSTLYFQLGRETEICAYELQNVMSWHGWEVSIRDEDIPGVSIEGEEEDIRRICEPLGGCIRAIEFLGTYSEDLLEEIESGQLLVPEGPWAVSGVNGNLRREREAIRASIKKLIKHSDRAHGREERPKPGHLELSPARSGELHLDEKRSEVCLWKTRGAGVAVGVTHWVSDMMALGKRDMQKPFRPQRRGLLPPKLARQMINLARTSTATRLLDPFCGCGVTLIEGMDLGLEVAGSDNRDEAIRQSRKNIDWFLSQTRPNPGSLNPKVLFLERIDVRQLSRKVAPLSLDSVVGEGDLGPPIRGRLSRKAAAEFSSRLEPLYARAFAEIRTVLAPGGRVSLALPFWQPNEGDPIFINLKKKLPLIGYQPAFPEKGFEPFLYRRKDQKVGRAIYVLESPR